MQEWVETEPQVRIEHPNLEFGQGQVLPSNLTQIHNSCYLPGRNTTSLTKMPVLDDFSRDWYSSHLIAADEASLVSYAQSRAQKTEAPVRQIRFLWLRSFDPPVVVRFSASSAGTWRMKAKRLSGAGGYEPGEISDEVDRSLTQEEASRVMALVDGADLLSRAARKCPEGGLDGARWIVESLDEDSYRYIDRWTPMEGQVHDFGLLAIELTGWNIEAVDIY